MRSIRGIKVGRAAGRASVLAMFICAAVAAFANASMIDDLLPPLLSLPSSDPVGGFSLEGDRVADDGKPFAVARRWPLAAMMAARTADVRVGNLIGAADYGSLGVVVITGMALSAAVMWGCRMAGDSHRVPLFLPPQQRNLHQT